jgi:chromosomal replication initiation ATPase DnaA
MSYGDNVAIRNHLEARGLLEQMEAIARVYHVTLVEMWSTSHELSPSMARQRAWADLRATGHWSWWQIAKLFGRSSHKTIMEGVRMHRRREAA